MSRNYSKLQRKEYEEKLKEKAFVVACRLLGKETIRCKKCRKLCEKNAWVYYVSKYVCLDCDPLPF